MKRMKPEERLEQLAMQVCELAGWAPKKLTPVESNSGWYVQRQFQQGVKFELWFDKSSGHADKHLWYGFSATAKKIDKVCAAAEKVTDGEAYEKIGDVADLDLLVKESEGKSNWCGIYSSDLGVLPAKHADHFALIKRIGEFAHDIAFILQGVPIEDIGADRRSIELRAIAIRQGQGKFRNALMVAYRGKCAISGCDAKQALEAAHIFSYKGSHSNIVPNGILLRSDLHTLFDLDLIWIDWIDEKFKVRVSPDLIGTVYKVFEESSITLPTNSKDYPDPEVSPRIHADMFI